MIHVDIETYSPVPLADCGNYKYAMHPDFEILLVAYAYDDEPVRIVDLASGEKLSGDFLADLVRPEVIKCAHNAVFERVCFTMYLRKLGLIGKKDWLDPEAWDCTMVRCFRAGLPGSLAEAGAALRFEDQKMAEGKDLIKKFCLPQKAGALVSDRIRPEDAPEDWATFKSYCIRDVEVERQLDHVLIDFSTDQDEQALYAVDQRINDRGVLVDVQMAQQATKMDAMLKAGLIQRARELTKLNNPVSVTQLRAWLASRLGDDVPALRKADVTDILKDTDDPVIREVLEIRQQASKTSNAKYPTMLDAAGPDNRVRGLLQFYGTRTGRWAGRLVQLQNLPQNHLPLEDLDFARRLVKEGNIAALRLCYGDVNDTLSQLIRTAFVAPEGKTFVVCDFSAIEARVLAWLAGESWVLEAFKANKDIYCETASKMFHVTVEKHGANADLRQKGKVAVLALGYNGGTGALDKMGGQRMGMTPDEEQATVKMWREANPHIVDFWGYLEEASHKAVSTGEEVDCGPVSFRMRNGWLLCRLPSGRDIAYPEVGFTTNRFGKRALRFRGVDQQTKKWTWLETYGGKLAENVTQAVARDCLGEVLRSLDIFGHRVVFHVHDEVIVETRKEAADTVLKKIKDIFAKPPQWAPGLPLKGAGYITDYYLKD